MATRPPSNRAICSSVTSRSTDRVMPDTCDVRTIFIVLSISEPYRKSNKKNNLNKYLYMAECTAYTNIIVSNAGIAAANGTYVPYTTGTRGGQPYTIWTKNGLNSYPRIDVTGSDPGTWAILGTIPFPGAEIYNSGIGSYGSADCPVNLTWSVGPFGSGLAPTVTGTPAAPSEPTFGLPAESVALITSRFGTVANFLRLRNQGQV
jgi:hypothetical protein